MTLLFTRAISVTSVRRPSLAVSPAGIIPNKPPDNMHNLLDTCIRCILFQDAFQNTLHNIIIALEQCTGWMKSPYKRQI
ncbi:hypothetical protein AOQ84DRAFT_107857 [Glonium stellatum]|uniref:Uncharacterized protein n=1 Tax=Glonium stellatum TaxID=574774 RepID=A0A8E2EU58_9PEZI|nr:hypothetical protein AOQ84DRAFT_107857 [Glonium stellatum]